MEFDTFVIRDPIKFGTKKPKSVFFRSCHDAHKCKHALSRRAKKTTKKIHDSVRKEKMAHCKEEYSILDYIADEEEIMRENFDYQLRWLAALDMYHLFYTDEEQQTHIFNVDRSMLHKKIAQFMKSS